MSKILTILFVLIANSCGDNKLNKVETLSSFRLLAIQTPNPELTQATGLTVTARPYISDINGGGRIIAAVVDGCIDPGISFGAEANCEGNATKVTTSYSVDTSTLPLLNSGWGNYTSAIAIPDNIFMGKTAREQFNGVPFIIIFSFSVDGIVYKSFRRILITNRTTLNNNPTLSTLLLNGGTIAKPQNGDYLSAVSSGPETYDYLRVDGITEARREKMAMAWYVSSGNLDMPKVTASESIRYKSAPPTTQLLILVVLRDERGGVAVLDSML